MARAVLGLLGACWLCHVVTSDSESVTNMMDLPRSIGPRSVTRARQASSSSSMEFPLFSLFLVSVVLRKAAGIS